MKALSLIQPYATLIMLGYKEYETRSWNTRHRGYLGIHASVSKPAWAREVSENNSYIREALERHGLTFDTLPRGALLGTCEVAETLSIIGIGADAGLWTKPQGYVVGFGKLSPMEVAAGDYAPGRYAWKLEKVAAVAQPVPCRGALSLWTIPDDKFHDIEAQLYTGSPARECSYWEMPKSRP